MGMNFGKVVSEIITIMNGVTYCSGAVDIDTKIKKYGVTSLNFMKIVIQIETHFEIRFRDEDVNFNKLDTVKKLADLIIKYEEEMDDKCAKENM